MPPSTLRSILLRRASHRQQCNKHSQQQQEQKLDSYKEHQKTQMQDIKYQMHFGLIKIVMEHKMKESN